jgi:ATP-dependent exoDNAse (exonuclease V) beta subunit
MSSTLKIYKASAGSGKTFTLTVEYIYLMVHPNAEQEYLHTLAVTFTNKATAEMKDRILQHLYGIWKSLPSSQDYVTKILEKFKDENVDMSEMLLRQRSGDALTMILHDYSRFRVETIDSFFQSVLRTLARELGQSSKLQVDLNDGELLELAVDRMIDSLDQDDTLKKVVMQYVSDEIEENAKWNIQAAIKDFATCIFKEDFMQRPVDEIKKISQPAIVRKFRADMKAIMDDADTKLKQETQQLLNMAQSICTTNLTGSKNPLATFLLNILNDNKASMGKTLEKFLTDETALLLAKQKNNADACQLMAGLQTRFITLLKNRETYMQEYNTAKLARAYTNQLQLLSRIDEIVKDISNERETFPLSRTPTLLSRLIDGQDNPFIFEKIGTVLKNIMIDEFQDTSRLQWDNFRVLLFENQSLGGTDLIVGDIKQSIYRWRGGEWSLLGNLANTMHTWNPKTETLETNYRSQYNIIDFNNKIFPAAANLVDSIDPNARFKVGGNDGIYSDVKQNAPPKKVEDKQGYCSVRLMINGTNSNGFPKLTSEEMNEAIYEDMLEKIIDLHEKGLPLNKIAILLRTNSKSTPILEYFEEHAPKNIRIASDEAYLLGNSSLVTIIISAMRTLLHTYKEKPVTYHLFLMHYLTRVKKMPISMDNIMRMNAMEAMPSFLQEEHTRLKQMPLYELVEELYQRLGLEVLSEQEAYHYAFLDAVQLYLRDNPNDLNSFLEQWDAKLCKQSIPSGKQDGIRILTIHKSKGLEFHTVMLPHCNWDLEKDMEETLWCYAEDEHDEYNVLGKMPISKNAKMKDSFYKRRYNEEHLQSRVDELNALYVALTRASCNMYIWAIANGKSVAETPNVGNLLMDTFGIKQADFTNGIWQYEYGEPVSSAKKENSSDNRMQPDFVSKPTKMVSYKARLNFRQSNEARELFAGEDNARALGVLYHIILSEIRDATQTEHVLKRNRMQGRITQEQYEELSDYMSEMSKNSLIASWFAPDNHVFSECEILDPRSKRRDKRNQRPDRIVMNGNLITVIDYKFGEEHSPYKGQVANYMRLLKKLYPKHTVKGYLWYLKNATIEPVEKYGKHTSNDQKQ